MMQPSYASQKNEKLTKAYIDAMNPQTCEERLNDAIQETLSNHFANNWLTNVVKIGNKITMNTMILPTAQTVAFQDIVFLGHLQRDLVISHVGNIIREFDAFQVQPPRVFWSEHLNKYVVVDGQHTTIALWIIYTQILGLNDSQTIPVTNMPGHLEHLGTEQVRTLFLSINNNAESIAEADKHRLYVITHRTTNDNSPDARKHSMIQDIVEHHDMFFTHEYKADKGKPGALTRFSEWKTEDQDTLLRFAEYMKHTVAPLRAITVHEQDILMEFFRLQKVDNSSHWTTKEIQKVFSWANQTFKHDLVKYGTKYRDFPNSFYNKCREAVHDWVDTNMDVSDSLKVTWASEYYLMGVVLFTESLRATNLDVSLPSQKTMKHFSRTRASGFWPNTKYLVK